MAAKHLLVLLAVIAGCLIASERPLLTLAVNEEAEPPWITPSLDGLDQRLVAEAADLAGFQVRYLAMPWPRCLAQLEAGAVDGVLNASYTSERAGFARYPRDETGGPDPRRRLHRDSYSLFRRCGDSLAWSPTQGFTGLTGLIAAQQGYHIVALLSRQGVRVDDSVQGLLPNLEKLAAGRVQGAALHTRFVAAALRDHPELAPRIEALPDHLVELDYHLVFARRTARERPDPAEAVWNALAEVQLSTAHRARCAAAGVPACE